MRVHIWEVNFGICGETFSIPGGKLSGPRMCVWVCVCVFPLVMLNANAINIQTGSQLNSLTFKQRPDIFVGENIRSISLCVYVCMCVSLSPFTFIASTFQPLQTQQGQLQSFCTHTHTHSQMHTHTHPCLMRSFLLNVIAIFKHFLHKHQSVFLSWISEQDFAWDMFPHQTTQSVLSPKAFLFWWKSYHGDYDDLLAFSVFTQKCMLQKGLLHPIQWTYSHIHRVCTFELICQCLLTSPQYI